MEESEIIAMFWERNEQAVTAAEDAFGSYCLSIAENILHSREDAEECVNDTWLRAWQSIPPQRPARLRLFLGRITRNLAFDRYRAKTAEKRGSGEMDIVLDELEDCIASPESVEQTLDKRELQRKINAFLRELPERERRIFLRRYYYAEPVGKIADAFGLGVNHTSVILKRTRERLRKYLQKEGLV